MHNHHPAPELSKESMGSLLRRLSSETTMLVRQELDLARAEIIEKAKRAGVGLGMFAAAFSLALTALGALTTCLILALSLAMAAWLAALVVTVVFAAVSAIFVVAGRKHIERASPLVPKEAIDSTKESVEWLRMRMKSGAT